MPNYPFFKLYGMYCIWIANVFIQKFVLHDVADSSVNLKKICLKFFSIINMQNWCYPMNDKHFKSINIKYWHIIVITMADLSYIYGYIYTSYKLAIQHSVTEDILVCASVYKISKFLNVQHSWIYLSKMRLHIC